MFQTINPTLPEFNVAVRELGERLSRGEVKDFDHSNPCVCAVGKSLEALVGRPVTRDEVGQWRNTHYTVALTKLYIDYIAIDLTDQERGAKSIARYLETVE